MKTYTELTPQECNDLIAEKVMGWAKGFHRYAEPETEADRGTELDHVSPYETWIEPNGECTGWHVRYTVYAECGSEVWNPSSDLNACHLVEEKMDGGKQADYQRELITVVCGKAPRYAYQVSERGQYMLIHATASQKTEAILRAYGLIS